MTRFDLHPEELLDRAARGSANEGELTRLRQHLAECDVCRVERALATRARLDAAPLRDEELLVARLKRDVLARLGSPVTRRAPGRVSLLAAALVVATVAGVATAATLLVRERARPATRSSVSAPSTAGSLVPRAFEAMPAPPRPLLEPPPKAEPAPKSSRVEPVEPVSAAELFSRANQARREGKVREAARLYRALQERFSGSSEELVSRVTLGRLLLDRLGDSRGALVQFNSYLASPGGGALREEAMVGRALALGRIGRTAEERAAWSALVEAWPKSTHSRRAQARLAELAGGGPAPHSARSADSGAGDRTR